MIKKKGITIAIRKMIIKKIQMTRKRKTMGKWK